jgi:hypothetical protein
MSPPTIPEPDASQAAAKVLDTAIAIARDAPARRGSYVSHAKIYWPLIQELRAALDALGIEWRISDPSPSGRPSP